MYINKKGVFSLKKMAEKEERLKNYSRMRRIAREQDDYGKGKFVRDPKDYHSISQQLTAYLARADSAKKRLSKNRVDLQVEPLSKATYLIHENQRHMPEEMKERYIGAIQKRLERTIAQEQRLLSEGGERHNYTKTRIPRSLYSSIDQSIYLSDMLHKMKVRRMSGYTAAASALTAILGVIGGGFFLLTNFDASPVQLSPGLESFNWGFPVGLILLAIGLIAGHSWFKRK